MPCLGLHCYWQAFLSESTQSREAERTPNRDKEPRACFNIRSEQQFARPRQQYTSLMQMYYSVRSLGRPAETFSLGWRRHCLTRRVLETFSCFSPRHCSIETQVSPWTGELSVKFRSGRYDGCNLGFGLSLGDGRCIYRSFREFVHSRSPRTSYLKRSLLPCWPIFAIRGSIV
ncbi:hypothetical protein CONLIGDRAFT_27222 [Coniochaeta ligniaria NRRL 30616]|uniref:Uncharacterized protein n=1 Tax=Coniochaeta ligniaria NRRL 30616 TaxID=1408157 RepID=A0A1J7J4Z2_9PEZI|nr:hypothetical protein CONLIGDRAFT_27222 [Coniochaeta ligniaria NRRL 30616]